MSFSHVSRLSSHVLPVAVSKMKSFAQLRIFIGLLALVSLGHHNGGHVNAACPKLEPVHVNAKWFKSSAPAGGWYTPLSKGFNLDNSGDGGGDSSTGTGETTKSNSSVSITTTDSDTKSKKKQDKQVLCWSSQLITNGQVIKSAEPIYDCEFVGNETISELDCTLVAGTTLTIGDKPLPLPSKFHLTFVDTDNSTFVAVAGCAGEGDAQVYSWDVLATTVETKTVEEARVYKSLGITEQEGEEAKTAQIKSGRALITEGPCGLRLAKQQVKEMEKQMKAMGEQMNTMFAQFGGSGAGGKGSGGGDGFGFGAFGR